MIARTTVAIPHAFCVVGRHCVCLVLMLLGIGHSRTVGDVLVLGQKTDFTRPSVTSAIFRFDDIGNFNSTFDESTSSVFGTLAASSSFVMVGQADAPVRRYSLSGAFQGIASGLTQSQGPVTLESDARGSFYAIDSNFPRRLDPSGALSQAFPTDLLRFGRGGIDADAEGNVYIVAQPVSGNWVIAKYSADAMLLGTTPVTVGSTDIVIDEGSRVLYASGGRIGGPGSETEIRVFDIVSGIGIVQRPASQFWRRKRAARLVRLAC